MTFIKIATASAIIALLLMSAQTYALTRMIKLNETPQYRMPTASVVETFEYLNEQRLELSAKVPGTSAEETDIDWPIRLFID